MTDHSNATDMLNKSQREAAYWRERCEWQSIKTAPKDGTEVVMLDANVPVAAVGLWMEEREWAGLKGSPPWLATWFPLATPTHWMPLPAPPENITPESNDG